MKFTISVLIPKWILKGFTRNWMGKIRRKYFNRSFGELHDTHTSFPLQVNHSLNYFMCQILSITATLLLQVKMKKDQFNQVGLLGMELEHKDSLKASQGTLDTCKGAFASLSFDKTTFKESIVIGSCNMGKHFQHIVNSTANYNPPSFIVIHAFIVAAGYHLRFEIPIIVIVHCWVQIFVGQISL